MFDQPPIKVDGKNITPDKETGIVESSDDDIKRSLTEGVRQSGVPLAPIMPYAFYRIMSPADLNAVVAYLRSVKPIKNEVQTPEYRTAFEAIIPPGAEKPLPDEDMRVPEKAGFYWATIGHCMECHTPMEKDRLQFDLVGKGGREFKGPWGTSVSANITQHRDKGIGAWSDPEIKRAITQGISRDGRQLKPPMFYAAYARMNDADLSALVAWLRTVPPKD